MTFFDAAATIFSRVSEGLARIIGLIEEYTQGHGDLDAMQSEIEALDGWNWEQRVTETLHRLHLQGRIMGFSPGYLPSPPLPAARGPCHLLRKTWLEAPAGDPNPPPPRAITVRIMHMGDRSDQAHG